MSQFQLVEGLDITYPRGFKASGIRCGIKASGNHDLGILVADEEVLTFGSFTQNKIVAAPVTLSQSRLSHNQYTRGVIVNSGNANACTGSEGVRVAQSMMDLAETQFNLPENSLLICQTGIIGVQLDLNKVETGLQELENELTDEVNEFAEAILTTDTCQKTIALSIPCEGGEIRIGGAAKGSGMIHPNMATMLSFVTTDLELPESFREEFQAIVDDSYNSITVDGDTSTNDTALLMASKGSGLKYENLTLSEQGAFRRALFFVFADLAQKIIRDGEGATKFVEIQVKGAQTKADARQMARFVANSKLVKTALFGNDPNWGRIIAAVGNSGVDIEPNRISIYYDDSAVLLRGEPSSTPKSKLSEIAALSSFAITIDLDLGDVSTAVWTSDLSYEYVKINAEYTT